MVRPKKAKKKVQRDTPKVTFADENEIIVSETVLPPTSLEPKIDYKALLEEAPSAPQVVTCVEDVVKWFDEYNKWKAKAA